MSRKFSDWLTAYLRYTEDTEPCEMYRLWCGISAIASCLQRKVFLQWGDFNVFYPNFYIVLVGPPAARKGTAMAPAQDLLEEIGIRLAADEATRQKLIQFLMDLSEQSVDPNTGIMYYHSSMTIFSTEFTVFLSVAQDPKFIATLCKWYDCEKSFRYETVGRGTEEIRNVWVNILGATTPKSFRDTLPVDAEGSGLLSRSILVFEEEKGKVVIQPRTEVGMKDNMMVDLETIYEMKGQFKYTDGFFDAYAEWRMKEETEPPFKDEPKLQYYIQRRLIHVLKLSMVMSASRSNDMILTVDDFSRATEILTTTEKKMPRLFKGVGLNPLADVQARMMEIISEQRRIPTSKLMDMFWGDVSKMQFSEILATLETRKFCRIDPVTYDVIFRGGKDGGEKDS